MRFTLATETGPGKTMAPTWVHTLLNLQSLDGSDLPGGDAQEGNGLSASADGNPRFSITSLMTLLKLPWYSGVARMTL
jgi:hypothetical protein